MPAVTALDRAHRSFERHDWTGAHASSSSADRASPLCPEDLENLGAAAYLSGYDDETVDAWSRAHHAHLAAGDGAGAARCGFWLTVTLLSRGEMAPAFGWLARAQRVRDETHLDCMEHGFVAVRLALKSMVEGDADTAYEIATRAAGIAARFADPDLTAQAGLGRGQALIIRGDQAEGMTFLDEVMVAVTAGELSPIIAGLSTAP